MLKCNIDKSSTEVEAVGNLIVIISDVCNLVASLSSGMSEYDRELFIATLKRSFDTYMFKEMTESRKNITSTEDLQNDDITNIFGNGLFPGGMR